MKINNTLAQRYSLIDVQLWAFVPTESVQLLLEFTESHFLFLWCADLRFDLLNNSRELHLDFLSCLRGCHKDKDQIGQEGIAAIRP
jgi:hypothetical protein